MANTGPLVFRDEYTQLMGLFQGNWASLEITTDYAIWKYLKVTPEQAHLITSGMMFGRKARLLADLIAHSNDPKKSVILGAFNKIRSLSKRDMFAHSYVRSDGTSITFLDRNASGQFRAKEHTFTLAEFAAHVNEFSIAGTTFYNALGATSQEVDAFAAAALRLSSKDKTSPVDPSDRAP